VCSLHLEHNSTWNHAVGYTFKRVKDIGKEMVYVQKQNSQLRAVSDATVDHVCLLPTPPTQMKAPNVS
jgi:hypothetical protein